MTYLDTGHRHASMTDCLACSHCGDRFKKGEQLWNRMRRERPELFTRQKPQFQPSQKLQNDWDMLQERVKNDKLYRKHLELSFNGTPEERKREEDRANKGFYSRFYSEGGIVKEVKNENS